MVPPSYLLGGHAMMVVTADEELQPYLEQVYAELPHQPTILIDEFVAGATEVDVDALSDGTTTVVAGVMEHIEAAGIHSGDSATIVPPVSLEDSVIARMHDYTEGPAQAVGVRGPICRRYVI